MVWRVAWLILAGAFLYGLVSCPEQPTAGPMVSKMQDQPPRPAAAGDEPILPGIEVHDCPRPFLENFDLAAASGGPLRLEMISCHPFQTFGSDPGLPSPDGEKLARWTDGGDHAVEIARTTGGRLLHFRNRITFRNFASPISGEATEGFAWTQDSAGFWTVRQDVMDPSGFSLSDLRPIMVALDGEVRELPPLRGAGRLDALRWVGSSGLALAQFSTRGGYYRPERPNDEPMLAIIDAARGRVRHAIRARDLAPLRQRAEAGDLYVHDAAATVMANGRVRAVVELAAWREPPPAGAPATGRPEPVVQPGYLLVWTEGSAPSLRPVRERSRSAIQMAISPDGSTLLVLRRLEPQGVIIREHPGRRPGPPVPPPVPVEGVFAEAVDLSTGRQLWRLEARVEDSWGRRARPAISPDGRLALLDLPPQRGRRMFGLVRMADGAILHRFSVTQVGSFPSAFGFSPEGSRVWVTVGGSLFRYRLAA